MSVTRRSLAALAVLAVVLQGDTPTGEHWPAKMTLVSLVIFVGGILGLIATRHPGALAVMSFGALFLLLTEPATTVGPGKGAR